MLVSLPVPEWRVRIVVSDLTRAGLAHALEEDSKNWVGIGVSGYLPVPNALRPYGPRPCFGRYRIERTESLITWSL